MKFVPLECRWLGPNQTQEASGNRFDHMYTKLSWDTEFLQIAPSHLSGRPASSLSHTLLSEPWSFFSFPSHPLWSVFPQPQSPSPNQFFPTVVLCALRENISFTVSHYPLPLLMNPTGKAWNGRESTIPQLQGEWGGENKTNKNKNKKPSHNHLWRKLM